MGGIVLCRGEIEYGVGPKAAIFCGAVDARTRLGFTVFPEAHCAALTRLGSYPDQYASTVVLEVLEVLDEEEVEDDCADFGRSRSDSGDSEFGLRI